MKIGVSTTAKEVASADHISAGRLLLGLGLGWNLEEIADHVDFDAIFCWPKPVQKPHPQSISVDSPRRRCTEPVGTRPAGRPWQSRTSTWFPPR
jgi:hypothetical protein